jgi:uncharacterized protein YbjT (DUF2867 family)
MKFVLVAGATGYLGKHVIHALKRQGHRVRAIVRNREKLWKRGPFLEPAVGAEVDEIIVADLLRPETLHGICRNIEYIMTCFGTPATGPKQSDSDYQLHRHLLQDAQVSTELKKFICVSPLLGESDPRQAGLTGRERFIRELQESPTTSCIVRPALLFPTLTGYLHMAQSGTAYLTGDREEPLTPMHGADLAQVCLRAMIAKEKDWPVGGPESLSRQQIARLAFEVLGKPAKIKSLSPQTAQLLKGGLRLLGSRQADALQFALESAAQGIAAAPQGQHLLGDYFKEYIASPFFRQN